MKRKRDGINKRELVLAVSEKTDLTQWEVKHVLECFLEEIKEQYRNDKTVEIRGFGTFYPHNRDAHIFKFPQNGNVRSIPPRTSLRFKSSRKLLINH